MMKLFAAKKMWTVALLISVGICALLFLRRTALFREDAAYLAELQQWQIDRAIPHYPPPSCAHIIETTVRVNDYLEIKGDGVHDDTQGIQKLIDAHPLKPCEIVNILFGHKTYLISHPIDMRGQTLLGGTE